MAPMKAAILTVTGEAARSSVASDDALRRWLGKRGVDTVMHALVPNDVRLVSGTLAQWADGGGVDLVLTIGGTGASFDEVTAVATRSVIDREIPTFARPSTHFFRGVAGVRWRSVIVNLPDTQQLAIEYLEALWSDITQTVAELKSAVNLSEGEHTRSAVVALEATPASDEDDLLAKVSAELRERGWRVGGMRHDPSVYGLAVDHPSPDSLAGYFGNVDIILTEGFRPGSLPKIELLRDVGILNFYGRVEPAASPTLTVTKPRQLELDLSLSELDEVRAIAGLIEDNLLLISG